MLSAFRCRDIFFFSHRKSGYCGGNTTEPYDSWYCRWCHNDTFIPIKVETPQEWEFRNNSVRERGWENWDILWYLVPYGIWYYRNTKCKSSVYLIHTTISTEQQMLMKTVQFVICFVCKFLAFWLLRNKKCMIFTSNYVLA